MSKVLTGAVLLGLSAFCFLACDDKSTADPAVGGEQGALYLITSVVENPEGSNTYLKLLSSIEPPNSGEPLSFSDAVEVPGVADVWPHGGYVFVSSGEEPVVTRYAIDGGALVEKGRISFANHATWIGMSNNHFIDDNKSYMGTGDGAFVVWNPETMEIVKKIDRPAIDATREERPVVFGIDRGESFVRGNRLFLPFGWIDYTAVRSAPTSGIAVYDVESDALVDILEAHCPVLATVSHADNSDLYFSNWIEAPGAVVQGDSRTCAVRIPAGQDRIDPSWTLNFAELTGGRHGAALHVFDGKHAIMNVFHADHSSWNRDADPIYSYIFGPNWHLWSIDLESKAATEITDIEWNGGGYYGYEIDGRPLVVLTNGSWGTSSVFDVKTAGHAHRVLTIKGWSQRLFKIR